MFDDGTPIPEYCRIQMSNGSSEVHLRAYGSTSFKCVDASNGGQFNYSCEYHRLLVFQGCMRILIEPLHLQYVDSTEHLR